MNATPHTQTLQLPAQHPSYAGHFPGQPIVPGVLLLDAVVEAAQALQPEREPAQLNIVVCKFMASLPPGAVVQLSLSPSGAAGLSFRVSQGEQTVASGSLRWQDPA
jgi:3-hydroxymyristoyl/3-hydroxydecanoyl-(acyl carrier protein) dehydratase